MPLSAVQALVRVLTAWESLVAGGMLLGLYWLVHRIADLGGRSGATYKGPIQYSGGGGGKGTRERRK